jgi:hypothetical protein
MVTEVLETDQRFDLAELRQLLHYLHAHSSSSIGNSSTQPTQKQRISDVARIVQ